MLLTFETPLFRYKEFDRRDAFLSAVREKIRAIPGVINAGATSQLPLKINDASSTFYWISGQPRESIRNQVALIRLVTRDYFPTIGARLRERRFFEESDRHSDAQVVIVNETFANRNFAGAPRLVRNSSSAIPTTRATGTESWVSRKRFIWPEWKKPHGPPYTVSTSKAATSS